MDLWWHALNSKLHAKTHYHTESKDLATCGFQKKFQTHPPKPAEVTCRVQDEH